MVIRPSTPLKKILAGQASLQFLGIAEAGQSSAVIQPGPF